MDIVTIITSTAFASIIATVFSYLQWGKNIKISNITKERKKWRDDLRKIAEDIESAENVNDFLTCITQLKVRINTLGMCVNDKKSDEYFDKDGYIWDIIKSAELNRRNYKKYKIILIEAISLLMKADWERSKKEVSIFKNT